MAITNELAAFYRINPATAAKGVSVLTHNGLVEKRRGIGMFVAAGAREQLLADRRRRFAERFVKPMVAEAVRLDGPSITRLLGRNGADCSPPTPSDHERSSCPPT